MRAYRKISTPGDHAAARRSVPWPCADLIGLFDDTDVDHRRIARYSHSNRFDGE
jgi:hypothetical protein